MPLELTHGERLKLVLRSLCAQNSQIGVSYSDDIHENKGEFKIL